MSMSTNERVASYPENFLKELGERKFRNPDTGNEVVFVSLPEAEQKRIYEHWSKGQKGEAKPKAKKKPTFEVARKAVFDALKKNGWSLKEHLKTPQAEKKVGDARVLLHFRPQALYVEIKGGDAADRDEGRHDARSTWVDIRDVADDADRWTRDELPKIITHFTKVKMGSANTWVSRESIAKVLPRLASQMKAVGFKRVRASLVRRLIDPS
jgi:hypothetical protein